MLIWSTLQKLFLKYYIKSTIYYVAYLGNFNAFKMRLNQNKIILFLEK